MFSKSPLFSNAINALTIGYIVALAMIGAIAGTAHLETGIVIDAQASNAAVINLSGRQRMLSQRIAMLANHWSQTGSNASRDELHKVIDLFETSHASIIAGRIGGIEYDLPPAAAATLYEPPHMLDQKVREFVSTARIAMMSEAPAQTATENLTIIASAPLEESGALLAGLNQMVSAFQGMHEIQIQEMRFVQNIAFVVLVLALAIEAVLIFRPLVRRVTLLTESLSTAAITDPMTQVHNRRGFMLRGETLTAQRQNGAVFILDIDNFKAINDTHGHASGDACIIHMAKVAQTVFRDGDVFGRIGGEEFAAVLHHISRDNAIEVANRLRETVAAQPCRLDGINGKAGDVAFTISIGVRPFSQPTPLHDLVQDADAALYEAKRTGRNKVCTTAAETVTKLPIRARKQSV